MKKSLEKLLQPSLLHSDRLFPGAFFSQPLRGYTTDTLGQKDQVLWGFAKKRFQQDTEDLRTFDMKIATAWNDSVRRSVGELKVSSTLELDRFSHKIETFKTIAPSIVRMNTLITELQEKKDIESLSRESLLTAASLINMKGRPGSALSRQLRKATMSILDISSQNINVQTTRSPAVRYAKLFHGFPDHVTGPTRRDLNIFDDLAEYATGPSIFAYLIRRVGGLNQRVQFYHQLSIDISKLESFANTHAKQFASAIMQDPRISSFHPAVILSLISGNKLHPDYSTLQNYLDIGSYACANDDGNRLFLTLEFPELVEYATTLTSKKLEEINADDESSENFKSEVESKFGKQVAVPLPTFGKEALDALKEYNSELPNSCIDVNYADYEYNKSTSELTQ